MNDTLIKIIASQMGIPGHVLDELKTYRPSLLGAIFTSDGKNPDHVTLTIKVVNPEKSFLVTITLPVEQLKRFPKFYEEAVQLANS